MPLVIFLLPFFLLSSRGRGGALGDGCSVREVKHLHCFPSITSVAIDT